MFSLFASAYNPIGIDIGTSCIKLAQTTRRGDRVIEAVRWELGSRADATGKKGDEATRQVIDSLQAALSGRQFQGRQAIYCLGADQIKILNVRLFNVDPGHVGTALRSEIASRLQFSISEAEIRRLEVPNVSGEGVREFIVFVCHRSAITRIIRIAEAIDIEPVAIDIEPAAALRCTDFFRRRSVDRQERFIYLNIGFSQTLLAIFEGNCPLFIKYLPFGGARFSQSLAKWLAISFDEAHEMRRNNDDRVLERRDAEVNQTILTAMRPTLESMLNEIAMCIRYHSVSFRGKALSRLIVGGGEANQEIVSLLAQSFPQQVIRSNPPICLSRDTQDRSGQWDIAIGLSMKNAAA